jgi:hypothetical protein
VWSWRTACRPIQLHGEQCERNISALALKREHARPGESGRSAPFSSAGLRQEIGHDADWRRVDRSIVGGSVGEGLEEPL